MAKEVWSTTPWATHRELLSEQRFLPRSRDDPASNDRYSLFVSRYQYDAFVFDVHGECRRKVMFGRKVVDGLHVVNYAEVNPDPPQFRNLEVCHDVTGCEHGDGCFYAHTEDQVEAAIANLEALYPPRNYANTKPRIDHVQNDLFFHGRKQLQQYTRLCKSFVDGVRCRYETETGSRCRFAHDEVVARDAIDRCAAPGVCRTFNRTYAEVDLTNDLGLRREPDEPIEEEYDHEEVRDAGRYPSLTNQYFPSPSWEGDAGDYEPPRLAVGDPLIEASARAASYDRAVADRQQEAPSAWLEQERPSPLSLDVAAQRVVPAPLDGDKAKTELCPSFLRNLPCALMAVCTYAHTKEEVAHRAYVLFQAGTIGMPEMSRLIAMATGADAQRLLLEVDIHAGNATTDGGIWKPIDLESGIERFELSNGTFKLLVPDRETIWCGRWKNPATQTYVLCVVKLLERPLPGQDRDVSRELEIMQEFTSTQVTLTHICRLYAFCKIRTADGWDNFYAAIELCDMTIGQAVTNSSQGHAAFGDDGPSLQVRVQWCAEMAEGLAAVRVANIMHRDLKPSNVLLKRTGEGENKKFIVKIADFGASKIRRQVRFEDVVRATISLLQGCSALGCLVPYAKFVMPTAFGTHVG